MLQSTMAYMHNGDPYGDYNGAEKFLSPSNIVAITS